MDNKILKSQKIKTKKYSLLWIPVIVVFVFVSVVSIVQYFDYREGQELAITISTTFIDDYDDYKDDYKVLVDKFYDYYTYSLSPYGLYGDYASSVNEAKRAADESLGELLTSAGYDCYLGSYYLEHNGFVEYAINNYLTGFIIFIVLFVIVLVLNIIYKSDLKKEMIIENNIVVCKNGKKTVKEFMVKDITSVISIGKNGLKVLGAGISYQIKNIKNCDEIKTEIMSNISSEQVAPAKTQNQENAPIDIIKYKELLDIGVITQEEFDEKKKQLLSL